MIETIITSIAVGTFWFWLITGIASIILLACIENDHYGLPAILSIVLGLIYWKSLTAFGMTTFAIAVGSYAVIGILYSLFRWYRHVQKVAFKYREKYGSALTSSQKSDLKSDIRVSDHKARITGWIAYWPWSLFWNLTGNFFSMLYDTMTNAYQHIVDRALGNFTTTEEKPRNSKFND